MGAGETIQTWLAELAAEAAVGAGTQVSRNLAGRVIAFARTLERRDWSCAACAEPIAAAWRYCPACGGSTFLRAVDPDGTGEGFEAAPHVGAPYNEDPFNGGPAKW